MSVFSSKTWHITRIGLKATPLWKASPTPATFVLNKGSRKTLQTGFSSPLLQIEPDFSRIGFHIDIGPICTSKIHLRRGILRDRSIISTFARPKRWRSAVSHQTGHWTERSESYEPVFPGISAGDIHAIFGGSLDEEEGNELLRVLHHQRVSGTLDEEVSASSNNIRRGLAWLRLTLPVDEDSALIARLQREEYEADQGYIAYTKRNYSRSVLEELREHNGNKAAKREAAEREADERDATEKNADRFGDSNATISAPEATPKAVISRRANWPKWVKRYREEAYSSWPKAPAMTKFQRLWPSAVFTLAVVGLSILFSHSYVPPSRNARLWPDLPPAAATLTALIGMNIMIFLAWRTIPPAWKLLNHNFLVITAMPRSISMVGSLFSHQSVMHILPNMLGTWVIGTRLHDDVGRGTFLAIYFSTGVFASYTSLSGFVLRNHLHTTSLGASGALAGIFATWCWIHTSDTLASPFVSSEYSRNISMIGVLIFCIAIDIVGVFRRPDMFLTNHISHLSGYAAGIIAGESLKRTASLQEQSARETPKRSPFVDNPDQSRV